MIIRYISGRLGFLMAVHHPHMILSLPGCILSVLLAITPFSLTQAVAQQEAGTLDLDQLPYHEQVAVYQQLVAHNPHDARLYNNLGFCHYRLGNVELAEQSYSKALTLDPTYSIAYNNLGVLYLTQGQYARAQSCFEQALAHNPSQVKAMYNLGVAHFRTGHYFKALRCYRDAKKMDARYVEQRSDSEKVKQEVDEALKKNPENQILKKANAHLSRSSSLH